MPNTARKDDKPQGRRALKACIACKVGKRRCDHERPCGPCCARGLESECADEIKEIDPACTLCKKRKLKCDRNRPCQYSTSAVCTVSSVVVSDFCSGGRCCQQGRESECTSDEFPVQHTAKRQPDADLDGAAPITRKKRTVPGSPALCDSDSLVLEGHVLGDFLNSPSPADSLASSPTAMLFMMSPEHPMAFPEGTFNGWSHMLPLAGSERDWPKSLVRMFKMYRTEDGILDGILNNMPCRLQAAIVRVFRAVDTLYGLQKQPPPTTQFLADEFNDSSSWQSSLRCGMQTVRMDRSCGVMTGVDVNPFWSTLAGLHREEFVNRAFNGEMRMPTSELRQTCKLVMGTCEMLRAKLQAGAARADAKLEMKPVYSRFTRNWGRGETSDGVLVRMRTTSTYDPNGRWMYIRHSLVIVSPEEYDAVRQQSPELCEGFLIPVVGSKSAAELMSPQLLEDESFATMRASEEGRAALDRLADKIDVDFQFLFDFIRSIGMGASIAP